MSGRFSACVLALLLSTVGVAAIGPPSAVAAGSDAGAPTINHLTPAFSPNGDGDHDVARLKYRLPTDSRVSVRVFGGRRDPLFRIVLGRQPAGAHMWTWDGRRPNGKMLPQDTYRIQVRTRHGHVDAWTEIDLSFQARVWLEETFGRPRRETPTVYPRSRAVRDSVGLIASGEFADEGFRREVLLVKNPEGRVVLRRNVLKHPTVYVDGWVKYDPVVWDARDDRGRALPRGRYTAVVTGQDLLGNTGSAKLSLWVSSRRLEWVEETRTVAPADTAVQTCVWSPALGACDDLTLSCGEVVPSSRFPGGLSHRAGVCAGSSWRTVQKAQSDYYVPVTEAVRGVDAARVAFTGAPTSPGESDVGTLAYDGKTLTSSTGGQGDWYRPWIGKGQPRSWDQPRVAAGAVWTFRTIGTDSFDIASFTLDLRYLAPR